MEDSGYSGFSMDTALRVYLWKRNGMIIPDLDVKDTMFLSNIIRKNPVLKAFALKLEKLSKNEKQLDRTFCYLAIWKCL